MGMDLLGGMGKAPTVASPSKFPSSAMASRIFFNKNGAGSTVNNTPAYTGC